MINPRRLFFCSALLPLLLFANGAFADGTYQRTKDRKTLVWNSDPQPRDSATWSGARDEEGYATGYGTLTWYAAKQSFLTGSNIPSDKYAIYGRYSGNMVRGKLDGPVTAEARGKTSHATFAEGRKIGRWAPGPAPKRTLVAAETRTDTSGGNVVAEPAPPAAGPSPAATAQPKEVVHENATAPEPPAEGPSSVTQQKARQQVSAPAAKETPKAEMDESLRSLVGPPPLLRHNARAEASPHASVAAAAPPQPSVSPPPRPSDPSLKASEVMRLADSEATEQGYDLGEYQLPKPRFVSADGTWAIEYEPKEGYGVAGKAFKISVEDKTKKASLQK